VQSLLDRVPLDLILILLFLGLAIPWRGAARVRELLAREKLSGTDRLKTYASTIALQWFLALVIAWRSFTHGFTFAELGLGAGNWILTISVACGLALGMGMLQLAGLGQAARSSGRHTSRMLDVRRLLVPQTAVESTVFVALVLTAGLCEEFIYRGFLFAWAIRLTPSATFAVLGSSAFFAVAHAYQGLRGALTTFIFGIVLALSRLWTGSLIPAITAHVLIDLMVGFVALRWIRPHGMSDGGPREPTATGDYE
jgi:membrane protease YdiL (CAAX protease family)